MSEDLDRPIEYSNEIRTDAAMKMATLANSKFDQSPADARDSREGKAIQYVCHTPRDLT